EHDAEIARAREAVKALAGKTGEEARAGLKRAQEALALLEKSAPVLPTAMGVAEGAVTDAPLMRRGNHLAPGKVVPRRFPIALDRAMGGSQLHVANRGYLFDHTSKDATRYDSLRRSVYLPVIRNNLYPVYQLFDAPDGAVGNGDRATTTVATQALFWMNSELAMRASEHLAARLLSRTDLGDAGRV